MARQHREQRTVFAVYRLCIPSTNDGNGDPGIGRPSSGVHRPSSIPHQPLTATDSGPCPASKYLQSAPWPSQESNPTRVRRRYLRAVDDAGPGAVDLDTDARTTHESHDRRPRVPSRVRRASIPGRSVASSFVLHAFVAPSPIPVDRARSTRRRERRGPVQSSASTGNRGTPPRRFSAIISMAMPGPKEQAMTSSRPPDLPRRDVHDAHDGGAGAVAVLDVDLVAGDEVVGREGHGLLDAGDDGRAAGVQRPVVIGGRGGGTAGERGKESVKGSGDGGGGEGRDAGREDDFPAWRERKVSLFVARRSSQKRLRMQMGGRRRNEELRKRANTRRAIGMTEEQVKEQGNLPIGSTSNPRSFSVSSMTSCFQPTIS